MIDLTTTYMGLQLKNPLVISSSPISENIDHLIGLEEDGASAVVMYSIFEEQITHESYAMDHFMTQGSLSFAEALTYCPASLEPEETCGEYLEHIYKAKKALSIPVIGSLNAKSDGGWVTYAKDIQNAGADALELNVYFVATNPDISSEQVEDIYVDILKNVKQNVHIPVAIKIGPYFSALAHMVRRLDKAGADGLVLFNRFLQPDIDLESLTIKPHVLLSSSHEMRLPLRWVAIIYGQVQASLAATTGIHSSLDVIKMVMAGADATMLCSTLLKSGLSKLKDIRHGLEAWMKEHEYDSLAMMKGSMSLKSCGEPQAFERANYMKALLEFKK